MSNLSLDLPIHLAAAQQLVSTKRSRSSLGPKIGPNTYLRADNFSAHIRYHHTDIITLDAFGFTITNGGYFTPTTKTRLNIFLAPYGYHIVQRDGQWFYCPTRGKSLLVPYRNGDTKQMIADRFEQVNGSVH